MNPTELFTFDGKATDVWFCGKCRQVAGAKSRAEQCCQNYICEDCGKDTGSRSMLVCDACWRGREAKREQERFDAAEKLTDYSGPVFANGVCGQDYFESLEEMIETCKDEGDELPSYVWACHVKPFVRVGVDDVFARFEDEAPEDFDPDFLDGTEELAEALKRFEEANKDKTAWTPDFKRAVLVPTPTPGHD